MMGLYYSVLVPLNVCIGGGYLSGIMGYVLSYSIVFFTIVG